VFMTHPSGAKHMRNPLLLAGLVVLTGTACQSTKPASSRTNAPSSPQQTKTAKTPVPAPTADDHGWVQADNTIDFVSPAREVSPAHPPKATIQSKGEDTGAKADPGPPPSADALADAAAASWASCCPDLPNPTDLRFVLRTTLHSLIAPDFGTYHTMLTQRGCSLNGVLAAECNQLRRKIDFGYTDSQWAQLTEVEQAKAYWHNSIDIRSARWRSVSKSSIKTGVGYGLIEHAAQGMVGKLCIYQTPGGTDFTSDCMIDAVPVAHVLLTAKTSRGEAPITFCFGFDANAGKWFPFCVIVHHDDTGPNCHLRI
jgi:hypothetical protein